MHQLMAWMAASFLTLVAATAAHAAGCDPLTGKRIGPIPADLCVAWPTGTQTADADGDDFGDECDWDYDQDCILSIDDWVVVFKPAFATCDPNPLYDPAVDFNQDTCIGSPDLLTFGMNFAQPGFYPDYPN